MRPYQSDLLEHCEPGGPPPVLESVHKYLWLAAPQNVAVRTKVAARDRISKCGGRKSFLGTKILNSMYRFFHFQIGS
jgi:hypothetical protein